MADDRGGLCAFEGLDPQGCCPEPSAPGKDVCAATDQCYASYEECVACCTGGGGVGAGGGFPRVVMNRYKETMENSLQGQFEYCRHVCRSGHASTYHENDFLSKKMHCHSKSRQAPRDRLALPEGLQAVTGQRGQSCTDVCQGKGGMKCNLSGFLYINSCNRMEEAFSCTWCFSSRNPQKTTEYPYFLGDQRNKCFLGTKVKDFECDAKHDSSTRLCPCSSDALTEFPFPSFP